MSHVLGLEVKLRLSSPQSLFLLVIRRATLAVATVRDDSSWDVSMLLLLTTVTCRLHTLVPAGVIYGSASPLALFLGFFHGFVLSPSCLLTS